MIEISLPPIALVVLLIAAAFCAVMGLTIIRWPTIPAYFIAGAAVGPAGLGVLGDNDTTHFIAELGVILLLFTIGLKFSLVELNAIRRHVFWLGGAQTILTAALFALPAWYLWGNVTIALLIGSVVAMSSTAVVSQILIEQNITASPVGGRAMGVLLFQDIAVIPLIVIFSSGGQEAASLLNTVFVISLKIIFILAIVLYIGAPAMSRWFNLVARFGDKELYMLNLVLVIGLLSGLTALAGLSYALGAFIAGILISETLHRYRVLRIVEPFRHIFLGFFFMSLGILVDLVYLRDNWPIVVVAAAMVLIVKFILVVLCARFLGSHLKTSAFTALLLCGTGEFGFVLLTLAEKNSLLENDLFQLLLSANLLALICVPFLWRARGKIMSIIGDNDWLIDSRKMTDNLSQTAKLSNHVVLAGYGRTAQSIAGILRETEVPYVAIEEDFQILQSVGRTDHILYGEASSAEALMSAGIMRAKALIISFIDPIDSKMAVQRALKLNKKLIVMVRTTTVRMANELTEIGAHHAFVDAHELGFSLTRKLCTDLYQIERTTLSEGIRRARRRENPFFTGDFSDEHSDQDIFNGFSAQCYISDLSEILENCRVISWGRDGDNLDPTNTDREVQPGDELVLAGTPKSLSKIKLLLEAPPESTDDDIKD